MTINQDFKEMLHFHCMNKITKTLALIFMKYTILVDLFFVINTICLVSLVYAREEDF